MTIEQTTWDVLAGVGIEAFEQGQWAGGELPDAFATYYVADSTDVRHYDNLPTMCEFQVQVNFYARNPDELATMRKEASDAFLSSGWTRQGRGNSGGLDDKTGLWGWHMVFYLTTRESEA